MIAHSEWNDESGIARSNPVLAIMDCLQENLRRIYEVVQNYL